MSHSKCLHFHFVLFYKVCERTSLGHALNSRLFIDVERITKDQIYNLCLDSFYY